MTWKLVALVIVAVGVAAYVLGDALVDRYLSKDNDDAR